jgi:TPP-dependent pyruvate/acetoin dehydrogenase alpha subunit
MVTKAVKQRLPKIPATPNGGSLIGNEKLRQLYAAMLKFRVLEERACLLARQSPLAQDYAAAVGHEAAEVGCTIDLEKEDVVASARHDLVGNFLRGIPLPHTLSRLYRHPAQNEEMPNLRAGRSAPASIELASRLKKSRNVVVALSATCGFSDSIWRPALRAAKAESLPIIFVRRDELSEKTGASRSGNARLRSKPDGADLRAQPSATQDDGARDYGFPSIPVDGHDVVAVYRVAYESIQRARRGGGPTLIECKPYLPDPYVPHTERPSSRRRDDMALSAEWRTAQDPIRCMELYLAGKGLFRDSWKNRLVEEFSRKLDAAIEAAEADLPSLKARA